MVIKDVFKILIIPRGKAQPVNSAKELSCIGYMCLLGLLFSIASCKDNIDDPLYTLQTAEHTGLHFSNDLKPDSAVNMLNYMYFYNGAGIGAADLNNDGLIDLYFAGNQVADRIYLNQGNLQFTDITEATGLPLNLNWSTGVSVVDINNDGLMDIYVCSASGVYSLTGRNKLFVCKKIIDGIPQYEEQAVAYGLDFSGLSTQAAFFDMDLDGDLDMFLLNHSYHQDGSFSNRNNFLNTYDSLAGDRLFENNNGYFEDITRKSGIHSSAIGYGLGIVVSDINLDGLPDIYTGNDFHENDYLYINQGNGNFADELDKQIMHTSHYSMGVDIADINNDALPEIISLDMLPEDPYILKRSLGEDAFDVFQMKRNNGYHPQYARNALQLNRGNNLFSETGFFSGIYATDWSWAPLWLDMDNDGFKDLFISNGIPKRLNDIDYISYISGEEIQKKLSAGQIKSSDFTILDQFPEIKLKNKFFSNKGDAVFRDRNSGISNDRNSFSNGAIYADLDNDGDLDIVVSNINEPAFLYENSSSSDQKRTSISLYLKGTEYNSSAIGARAIVYAGLEIRTYEKFPVHGFQSSMNIPLHIGTGNSSIDSIILVWPDHKYQKISAITDNYPDTIVYNPNLPLFNFSAFNTAVNKREYEIIEPDTASGFNYKHIENKFNEFDRELLIPHVLTSEGPALAVADINHDGLEDIFIGASKRYSAGLFIQQANNKFVRLNSAALAQDSMCEDIDAIWVDINKDGHTDLIVASGGNEYYGKEPERQPRLYINDGKGFLTKKENAFENLFLTASVVVAEDINGDGYADLFVGGRAVPWEYGEIPRSYLLLNDGSGKFTDVTSSYSKELSYPGMVTDAVWTDMDADGKADLVLSYQWGGIDAYLLDNDTLVRKSLTHQSGWWNFILPVDINNDGHIDLIAGNLGLNSRLKADSLHPVKLYHADFDGNGKREQAITYWSGSREIPFFNKMEMDKQMPAFKKKFLYAEDFAKAGLDELLGSEKIQNADVLKADYFANAVLINDGNMNFSLTALPSQAQLTTYRDAMATDINGDGYADIVLAGNFFGNSIALGRNDADYGTLLINNRAGNFNVRSLSNTIMRGQSRKIRPLKLNGNSVFVIGKNNDKAIIGSLIQN